jgi:hypothetical protein
MADLSYERYGSLRVVRKKDQTLIRSRYTLGALYALWCGIGILIAGAYGAAKYTFSGLRGERRLPDLVGFAAISSIMALLSGIPYFYRKDELVIVGDEWTMSSWRLFQRTQRKSWLRQEVIGLLIDNNNDPNSMRYGLRMELMNETVLFYSDADLNIVRGAAEFLKPILGLPVRESLP